MNGKASILLVMIVMVSFAAARPQNMFNRRPGQNNHNLFSGQPLGQQHNLFAPTATGQGTGVANAGPGGTGIAIGIGAAVASPVANFAIGQGESTAIGAPVI